jgi:hypothetical protein
MRSGPQKIAGASLSLGLLTLLSVVLFSTCKVQQGGGTEPSPTSGDATALSGTWTSGCQPDAAKAGYAYRDNRTFDGGVFSTTFESFTDAACNTLAASQAQTGGFVIGESAEGGSTTELDITIGAVFMTILSEELAASYNERAFCGGGWKVGVKRELSRSACATETPLQADAPDMIFELFGMKGGQLLFGKKAGGLNGRAESLRPTTLDEARPFTRS